MRTEDPAGFDLLSTREGYDRWAEIYDGDDNPLVHVEEPVVRALVGDVRGLRVLDAGCGTGRHAVPLSRAGASVTALDFSAGMLAAARRKPGSDAIRFVQHDVTVPLPVADGSFDRVLSCLVADHVHDLVSFWRELGRVCAPGGFVLMTTVHPAMMLRGVQARFIDPITGRETRPASAAHSISDYVMSALEAGLRIGHIAEHAVDDALASRSARSKKYVGWPICFVMRVEPGGESEL